MEKIHALHVSARLGLMPKGRERNKEKVKEEWVLLSDEFCIDVPLSSSLNFQLNFSIEDNFQVHRIQNFHIRNDRKSTGTHSCLETNSNLSE